MAIPTVITDFTIITDCETVTDWTSARAPGLDTFDFKQGTSSISFIITAAGDNIFYYSGGPWNLNNVHIRFWLRSIINPWILTEANNGLSIRLSDGVNTDFYTIYGGDTLDEGWTNVVNLVTSAKYPTVNLSAITEVGLNIILTEAPKIRSLNVWLDYIRFGDGITVTGGTPVDPITSLGIASEDKANGYGIVNNYNNILFLTGSVHYGNGITPTYIEDDSSIMVFLDEEVDPALYKLVYQGSGCDINMLNSFIKTEGFNYSLICNDIDLNSLNISGCNFLGAGSLLFKNTQVITDSTFNSCGMIDPELATFENNVVKASIASGAATGALYLPLLNNVNNITFSDNDRDVYIDQAGTYNGVAFTHNGTSNYEIDYNNAVNSTFNVPSGGNTTQGGVFNSGIGTLTVVATSTKTITGLPAGCEARVVRGAYTLAYEDNILDGDFVYSYTPDNRSALMRFTLGGYTIENIEVTLDSTDQTLPATVKPDQSYIP